MAKSKCSHRRMKLSEGQKQIIALFGNNFETVISTQVIVAAVGYPYYHNAAKHVGERLTRLVNQGYLKRPKKGCYQLGEGKKVTLKEVVDPSQQTLF